MSLLDSLGLTVAYDRGFRQNLLESIVLVIISLKNIGPRCQGYFLVFKNLKMALFFV